jgi:hypothetical protein
MQKHWLFAAVAVPAMFFGALTAPAQTAAGNGQNTTTAESTHWYSPARYKKYNPIHLIRRDSRTASEQLAANQEEDKKLTVELQSLLPPRTDVRDMCSAFKTLEDCVAAIHASYSVGVRFECLKWNMTAVKPSSGAKSCAEPEMGRPLTLERAILELKPGANAKYEAKNALRKARENISDARS